MTIALVVNVSGVSSGGSGFTTSSVDTTGATLLVASVNHFNGVNDAVVSDSNGNTWVGLTAQVSPTNNARTRLFYVVNPTVGAGHTFTLSPDVTFGTLQVAAFSGVATTSPFDAENGSSADTATSIQPGSVTPSEANCLVITSECLRDNSLTGDTVSINGGFTITNQNPGVGSNYLQGALAYLIQTSAAAANPTWSWTTSDSVAAAIAVFKSAGGGGGGTAYSYWAWNTFGNPLHHGGA
jgi:hypothetical protein